MSASGAQVRPARDFALAFAQLTVLPVRASWPEDERPDVAGWYPLVGAVLGAAGAAVAGYAWTSSRALGAAVAVALLAAATGGLHWDGLADVADAWHVDDPERRLAVLKDSSTGAFGTLAVALIVVMQVVALSALAEKGAASLLIVAAVAGRLAASFSAWLGRPARADGLGAAVSRRPGFSAVVGVGACGVLLAGMWWLGVFATAGRIAIAGSAVGIGAALVVPHLVARRFGGTSGDTMGASVVLVETLVLVLATVGALG